MAFSTAVGAGIAGAGATAGGIIGSVVQGEYNKARQQDAMKFEEHMRDTSFISAVNQAKQLGISPSLLLGQQASAGAGVPSASISNENAIGSGVNAILGILKQDRKLDAQEKMQDRYLDYMEHHNAPNVNATAKKGIEHKYTKEQLDKLWTDLDNVTL